MIHGPFQGLWPADISAALRTYYDGPLHATTCCCFRSITTQKLTLFYVSHRLTGQLSDIHHRGSYKKEPRKGACVAACGHESVNKARGWSQWLTLRTTWVTTHANSARCGEPIRKGDGRGGPRHELTCVVSPEGKRERKTFLMALLNST